VRSAELASLRSIDPAKTRVDGGRIPDLLTVARQRAAKQLRSVDEALIGRFGSEGLTVSRGVLYDRKRVEQVAKEHGAESDRDIRSVGWLFRRCLDTLALRLGFLTSTRALAKLRRKVRDVEPAEPADDPGRHASAAD
jgi:hypothetical protein